MNMKNIQKIGMLLVGVVVLFSCDLMGDIDNIKPQHQLEEDNVIRNEESANMLLRSVYENWRTFTICAVRTNMSFLGGGLEITGSISGAEEFEANNVQEDNTVLGSLYSGFYKIINLANTTKELLEKGKATDISESRLREMISECLFHRALAHFSALRHWGQFYDLNSKYGVEIHKVSVHGLEYTPRSSVAEVYQCILEDLNYASLYAPEESLHYYISRTTAKALKAKVLLSMGNYEQAELLADTVIREAAQYGYVLEDNYEDIFQNSYDSKEVLWALYVFGTQEASNGEFKRTKYGSYTAKIADEMVAGEGNKTTGEGFDRRFAYVFALLDSKAEINRKYPFKDSESGKKGNTYYFLRLAEVYYIYAEAAVRNGHYDAAKLRLEEVLDRAGYTRAQIQAIPDSKLLELVRQHKWVELVSENYEEWFDLVRYYKAGNLDIKTVKSSITLDSQLVLPIPKDALAGNKALIQNP